MAESGLRCFLRRHVSDASYSVRGTLGLMGPFVVMQALGAPTAGAWLGIGAFIGTISDPGTDTRYPARAAMVWWGAVASALGVCVAELAGNSAYAMVPVTFIVSFACIYVAVLGDAGDILGQSALNLFVMMPLAATGFAVALGVGGYVVAGGILGVAFLAVPWRFRPQRPAYLAAAKACRAIAELVDAGRSGDTERMQALKADAATQLEKAQATTVVPRWQPAPKWLRARTVSGLLARLGDVYRLSLVVAMGSSGQHPAELAELGEDVDAVQTQVAASLRAAAERLGRGLRPLDTAPVWQALAAARDAKRDMQRRSTDFDDETVHQAIGYSASLRALDGIAVSLQEIARALDDLRTGTANEAPAPSQRPAPDAEGGLGLRALRANLSLQSVRFRHALRVAAATTLGILLYALLDLQHGYWIGVTIVAILYPVDYGHQVRRVLMRVVATTGGAAVAAVLVTFVPGGLAFIVMLTLATVVVLFFWYGPYGYFVFFLTPWVIMINQLTGGAADAGTALSRVGMTVVGGIIAFLFGAFFLPNRGRVLALPQMRTMLRTDASLLRTLLERGSGRGGPLMGAIVENSNARAAIGLLAADPHVDSALLGAFSELVAQSQAITDGVIALDTGQGGRCPIEHPPLRAAIARAADVLEDLEMAVAGGRPPGTPPDFGDELQALDAEVGVLAQRRRAEIAGGQLESETDMRVDDAALNAFSVNLLVTGVARMHDVVSRAVQTGPAVARRDEGN